MSRPLYFQRNKWLSVFSSILLFAAVIAFCRVIISLGKASFQFLLEMSSETLLCDFDPIQ